MTFTVDILKKLPGFELQVALNSGRETIGVLGASGSGKSMLLRAIAGLVTPDAGRIRINGTTFYDSAQRISLPPRDRKVGFLFQNYALFPHLSLKDNIAFGLDSLNPGERQQRVSRLLERFHLTDMAHRLPSQISGGQQQRTALARALAVEPEILLLDEPFSALDDHLRSQMIVEMHDFLREFQGCAILVTHNREEAYRLCDRIAILKGGRVEAFDEKHRLFQSPPTLETALMTGCRNHAPAVPGENGLLEVSGWGISVRSSTPGILGAGYVGIRTNHLRQAQAEDTVNVFPAWIAGEIETPFRTTFQLKLGSESRGAEDYHLLWEVSQTQAQRVRSTEGPLRICLDPEHLFYFPR